MLQLFPTYCSRQATTANQKTWNPEPSHVLTFAIKKQPQGKTGRKKIITRIRWDGMGEKNDVAVEIVVEIGKRAKKISAANDLCAIEINPKFIYFCHKTRMQSRQKGLLAKTIVIVCVWQAFVVPVCICV